MTEALALVAGDRRQASLYGFVRGEATLDKISGGYRGRERRVAVAFEAALIEPDGCAVPVTVLDVSSSGFRITCNAELIVGEEVHLQLPRSAPVRATICWTRGDEAGGIFLDPATVG